MAALFIDDLVKHIREQDWKIISPAEAYTNSIASYIPDVLENGEGRVAAIAKEKGYTGSYKPETVSAEYLDRYYENLNIYKDK